MVKQEVSEEMNVCDGQKCASDSSADHILIHPGVLRGLKRALGLAG